MPCYAGWQLNHSKDNCIYKLLDFSACSMHCCFLNCPLLHQEIERPESFQAEQMRTTLGPEKVVGWVLSLPCWRRLNYPMISPNMHPYWQYEPFLLSSLLWAQEIFMWMKVLHLISPHFQTCSPGPGKASDFGRCQYSCIPLLWECPGLK